MKMTRQHRETRQIELVETYNISLSLHRINDAPNVCGSSNWKRALYHALSMSGVSNSGEIEKIRIALQLP